LIIDTDVLIWYMRGNPEARNFIEKEEAFSVSVVTYAELLQGMRNKQELRELRSFFRAWNVRLLYISEEISGFSAACRRIRIRKSPRPGRVDERFPAASRGHIPARPR